MRVVLKPLPVLVACAGCERHGHRAREAADLLDRRRQGESAWLGAADLALVATKARSRWPVFALDGCAEGCARAWLERTGVSPERAYILEGMSLPRLGE